MKWIIPILLLVSCGQDQTNNNHGYGFNYDDRGATGTRVRYSDESSIRLEDIERVYLATAECIGVDLPPGPLVIWVEEFRIGGPNGKFTFLPAEIFLDTGTIPVTNVVKNDRRFAENVLRHEFVHWILFTSGLLTDHQSHVDHDSTYFDACSYPSGVL